MSISLMDFAALTRRPDGSVSRLECELSTTMAILRPPRACTLVTKRSCDARSKVVITGMHLETSNTDLVASIDCTLGTCQLEFSLNEIIINVEKGVQAYIF